MCWFEEGIEGKPVPKLNSSILWLFSPCVFLKYIYIYMCSCTCEITYFDLRHYTPEFASFLCDKALELRHDLWGYINIIFIFL